MHSITLRDLANQLEMSGEVRSYLRTRPAIWDQLQALIDFLTAEGLVKGSDIVRLSFDVAADHLELLATTQSTVSLKASLYTDRGELTIGMQLCTQARLPRAMCTLDRLAQHLHNTQTPVGILCR